MSLESRKTFCFESQPFAESECTASLFRDELFEEIKRAKLKSVVRSEVGGEVKLKFDLGLSAAGIEYTDAVSRLKTTLGPINVSARDIEQISRGEYSTDQVKQAVKKALDVREAFDEKQFVHDLQILEVSRSRLLKENPSLGEEKLPDFKTYSVNSLYDATSVKRVAFYSFKARGIHDEATKYAVELMPHLDKNVDEKTAIQSYLRERSLTISPSMQKRFGEIFDKLDVDHGGTVSKEELETFSRLPSNAEDSQTIKALLHHYDKLPLRFDDTFWKKDEGISRSDMANLGGPAQDQPAKMIDAIWEWMNSGSNDSIYTAAQYKVFTAN
jgi:hypothetical protein